MNKFRVGSGIAFLLLILTLGGCLSSPSPTADDSQPPVVSSSSSLSPSVMPFERYETATRPEDTACVSLTKPERTR